jgi:HlyD family secretion protein
LLNVQKAQISLEKMKQGAEPKDIASAQERVTEAQKSLERLQKGADAIDLQMSQNSVAQRAASLASAQNTYADAQAALKDYTIVAPFDGIIAKVPVQVNDQGSPSTAVVTLLTHAQVAQVTLNEVDVAKVKVGQKVSLTFDAVPDLTIAGTVSEVDPLGAATQGVVNYTIKIAFGTQDDRVKPGMSVSAAIVTDVATDVVVVPNAAIKRQGNNSTVQIATNAKPSSANDGSVTVDGEPAPVAVEVGLSDDRNTEIKNGLSEGVAVVTRTIDPNAVTKTAATTNAASGLRLPGVGGGGFGGGGLGGGNFGAVRAR